MGAIHISVGAGFENDRRDPGVLAAEALAAVNAKEPGSLYLIFECLAERSLAKQALSDSLESQISLALSHLLPSRELCKQHGIRIVTNHGGIDPVGVTKGVRKVLGGSCLIASVTGDRLPREPEDNDQVLTRNCYTGAKGIVAALEQGADIVLTGRVADPSLVVGPVVHELGFDWTDWNALANATLAGHLIECGTQVTGGYFADEGFDVPQLASVGPPVATVTAGAVRLTKPIGGGLLNRATVIEQMLYEIGDPSRYITPDVVLDLSNTEVQQVDLNVVKLVGATGHPAPSDLKSLLCRKSGWIAEGSIVYLGTTADSRARIAREIIEERILPIGIPAVDIRYEILSGYVDSAPQALLQVSVRSDNKLLIDTAMNELEALYLNGPAAGGGIRTHVSPSVETVESLVPRHTVEPATVELRDE